MKRQLTFWLVFSLLLDLKLCNRQGEPSHTCHVRTMDPKMDKEAVQVGTGYIPHGVGLDGNAPVLFGLLRQISTWMRTPHRIRMENMWGCGRKTREFLPTNPG